MKCGMYDHQHAVAVGDLHRVAEHRSLRLVPELAEPFDRQLALFAARGVHRVLEAVHRDLAEHGRDLVLEVRGEQREPLGRIGHRLEQATERDRLAEHRRGLGERERRPLVEHALAAREVRVQAVAELVRERQHVAPARRPVEQEVRVMRRHRVRAERCPVACRAGPARRSTGCRRTRARCRRARRRTTRTRRARAPSPRPSRSRSRPRRPKPCGRSRRAGRCRAAGP